MFASVPSLLIFGESKHALGDYVGCDYGLDVIGFWWTENQRISRRHDADYIKSDAMLKVIKAAIQARVRV